MCRFFRWDRRCTLGGGVGVELVKWDFGSRFTVQGTALRNGKRDLQCIWYANEF